MLRSSRDAERPTDSGGGPASLRRGLVAARVTAMCVAAVVLLAYLHRQLHAHPAIVSHSPLAQAIASALLLTGLACLILWSLPRRPFPKVRGVIVIFAWMLLLATGHTLSHHGMHDAQGTLLAMRDALGTAGFAALAAAYALTLALPFVPGVELGLLIIALFGPIGAITAYLATVVGLSIAYAAGHLLPPWALPALLDRLGIAVPAVGIEAAMHDIVCGRDSAQGLRHRSGELLIKYRFLALAICLNFPGNSIVGGGGGLALLSGASRQFAWQPFLLTVALAVAPVPLLVLAGLLNVAAWLKQEGVLHNALIWIDQLVVYLTR